MAKKIAAHVRKKAKPRASVAVMTRRYEAKLARLKEQQKLIDIKNEVKELQELIRKGY